MPSLSLTLPEIIILMTGAIVLGITIHFFITSRRNMKMSTGQTDKVGKGLEEWKLKYFNDIEIRDKELAILKARFTESERKLGEAEENSSIYMIEAEEMRKENKKLQLDIANVQKNVSSQPSTTTVVNTADKPAYLEQLKLAQSSLMDHNEKINQLLDQIDLVKANEESQQIILKDNEQLVAQISDLKQMLSQKEKEVSNIRQKENLTKEMTSMLDSAYNEFDALQNKIQKLESQVTSTKMINMEYEDIKESHVKITHDYEEQKLKYNAAIAENQKLQLQLNEAEDQLKETNFLRQQLQKRVGYLEELNSDLQAVSDANKKLEGQLKRIGELESRLNMVSEERDELAKKQISA